MWKDKEEDFVERIKMSFLQIRLRRNGMTEGECLQVKILQLIYESFGSPFGFGGAGVRAYEIYKRLKDRHDITLLCLKYPNARDGDIEGLKHIFVGTENKSLTKSVLAYTIQAARFVRRYGNDFDIIVENFLPPTPFFTTFLTKTPVILQVQDFWGEHTFKRYPFRYALPMVLIEKLYPRLYKHFIFVSDITLKHFHLSQKAVVHLVPNGIDMSLLCTHEEAGNYILFMSSIDMYKKGLDILLKAFSRISPFYQNLNLYIAGSGRDSDLLKYELETIPCPVRKNIKLLGWLSGEDKIKAISKALFTVLPSRHESQPINILESAACEKPVIVSDIPELHFVYKEGFGLSFPSGSIDGLKEKMEILIKDNKQREVMGRRGREFSSKFLWGDIANQFEDVLKAHIRSHDH